MKSSGPGAGCAIRSARQTVAGNPAALAGTCLLAGCSSNRGESASQMTSFSSKESKSATPELFTMPADQISLPQVVTIEPVKLRRRCASPGRWRQRVQKDAGDHASRRAGNRSRCSGPASARGPADAAGDKPGLLTTARTSRRGKRFAWRTRDYARAQDLYQRQAIAERDLLQAESDRNQAQADLMRPSEHENSGNQEAGRRGEGGDSGRDPRDRTHQRRGGERMVSPGQVMQAGQTQAFTISDMSTVWGWPTCIRPISRT